MIKYDNKLTGFTERDEKRERDKKKRNEMKQSCVKVK